MWEKQVNVLGLKDKVDELICIVLIVINFAFIIVCSLLHIHSIYYEATY